MPRRGEWVVRHGLHACSFPPWAALHRYGIAPPTRRKISALHKRRKLAPIAIRAACLLRPLSLAGPLIRYALAIAGPIGSAGAQFLLSLVLLRVMTPDAFGRFSFLLIASQLSWGIWTALFCAPLPILVASHQGAARVRLVRCLMLANLMGSAAAFLVFTGIGLLLGAGTTASLLFAGYAAVALLRTRGERTE